MKPQPINATVHALQKAAMTHDSYSDDYIADILGTARVFAFVGASANTSRPSYFAMKYLLGKGYGVIPINPGLAGQELLGQKVYASLAEVPGPVDVVDIFRSSDAALGIVRQAIALKDKLGLTTIWMQLGVRSDEAAAEAEAAGLKVVMNRCAKIEYGRLSGEIGWAGVNSGKISSSAAQARRPRCAEPRHRRQALARARSFGSWRAVPMPSPLQGRRLRLWPARPRTAARPAGVCRRTCLRSLARW